MRTKSGQTMPARAKQTHPVHEKRYLEHPIGHERFRKDPDVRLSRAHNIMDVVVIKDWNQPNGYAGMLLMKWLMKKSNGILGKLGSNSPAW